MHPVEALLQAKLEGLKVLQNQITSKRTALSQHEAVYTSVLNSVELDKKSVEAVKAITERLSSSGIAHIQAMVSRGLQAIFTDDVYSFEIDVMERGTSKTVEFFIKDSKGIRTPISKCGGGLIVMSSFLLRVYLIIKLKLMRLVVLDEAFVQVSKEYTEGLMDFLHTLVDEANFRFLWVSHQDVYSDKASHVYRMHHGVAKKLR